MSFFSLFNNFWMAYDERPQNSLGRQGRPMASRSSSVNQNRMILIFLLYNISKWPLLDDDDEQPRQGWQMASRSSVQPRLISAGKECLLLLSLLQHLELRNINDYFPLQLRETRPKCHIIVLQIAKEISNVTSQNCNVQVSLHVFYE